MPLVEMILVMGPVMHSTVFLNASSLLMPGSQGRRTSVPFPAQQEDRVPFPAQQEDQMGMRRV